MASTFSSDYRLRSDGDFWGAYYKTFILPDASPLNESKGASALWRKLAVICRKTWTISKIVDFVQASIWLHINSLADISSAYDPARVKSIVAGVLESFFSDDAATLEKAKQCFEEKVVNGSFAQWQQCTSIDDVTRADSEVGEIVAAGIAADEQDVRIHAEMRQMDEEYFRQRKERIMIEFITKVCASYHELQSSTPVSSVSDDPSDGAESSEAKAHLDKLVQKLPRIKFHDINHFLQKAWTREVEVFMVVRPEYHSLFAGIFLQCERMNSTPGIGIALNILEFVKSFGVAYEHWLGTCGKFNADVNKRQFIRIFTNAVIHQRTLREIVSRLLNLPENQRNRELLRQHLEIEMRDPKRPRL
jgi:hypothetical protein